MTDFCTKQERNNAPGRFATKHPPHGPSPSRRPPGATRGATDLVRRHLLPFASSLAAAGGRRRQAHAVVDEGGGEVFGHDSFSGTGLGFQAATWWCGRRRPGGVGWSYGRLPSAAWVASRWWTCVSGGRTPVTCFARSKDGARSLASASSSSGPAGSGRIRLLAAWIWCGEV